MKKINLLVLLFVFLFFSCSKKNMQDAITLQINDEQSSSIIENNEVYLSDKIEISDNENLIQMTYPRINNSIINFSCLAGNYTDKEIDQIKNIKLEECFISNLKDVNKFYNLEKLSILFNDTITDISDLDLLKKIKFFTLQSYKLNFVLMQNFPESLERIYLYCPIKNDIKFTEENRNLKIVSIQYHLPNDSIEIKNISGLENLVNILGFSVLYCPIENPEELLKLKGLSYEIDFTVSRKVTQDKLNEIIKELKINNPDCRRIFGCYYDEIEKIEKEFISPE